MAAAWKSRRIRRARRFRETALPGGSVETSPAVQLTIGLLRMEPTSIRSTGTLRNWWAMPLTPTARSMRSRVRRFPTTARRAWRDSDVGHRTAAIEVRQQSAPTDAPQLGRRKPMFDTAPRPHLSDHPSFFRSRAAHPGSASDQDRQRANGSGRIVLSGSERGTRIMHVFERSPIRIMFPRAAGGAVDEAVLVNTGGGIAGGDRLEFSVTALANASIAVTSQ